MDFLVSENLMSTQEVNSPTSPVVYIVDDDDLMRDSLERLCRSIKLFSRCFGSAHLFLDELKTPIHGCLITDLRMPGISGLELLIRLRKQGFEIPVIMISGYGDIPSVVEAMKLGAVEFFEKPFNNQALIDCINRSIVMDAEKMRTRLLYHELEDKLTGLTQREQEVMQLVLTGKTSRELAHELKVSVKTIEAHRANILKKTGTETFNDLMKLHFQIQSLKHSLKN